jgi:hypothetical protein
MSEESTTPDLVERTRLFVWSEVVRATYYNDTDQASAAAERLAEERA